ncbi:hypothetical protein Tco_0509016 [Tanacetum coccineum]
MFLTAGARSNSDVEHQDIIDNKLSIISNMKQHNEFCNLLSCQGLDLVGVRQLPKRHGGVDDGVLDGFVDYEKHSLHGISLGILPILPSQVCLEVHYTEMSSIEKEIVALTLEDNVRSLVMVADAYKHYSWYCKVHREIEGELSDEANVADPAKVGDGDGVAMGVMLVLVDLWWSGDGGDVGVGSGLVAAMVAMVVMLVAG